MFGVQHLRTALSLWTLAAALPAYASPSVPLGLPPFEVPRDAQAVALAALGKRLFFDKRLSADRSISCGSCHLPERAFTDGRPTARGLHGRSLTRRTPSLLNVRYAESLFWDGRATQLEAQVRLPLLAPIEHGLPDERAVGTIVRSDSDYASTFVNLLGVPRERISIAEVGAAIAAYERTLTAGNSAFDRYEYGGDSRAMSAAAVRGLALFRGRAQCSSCHLIGATSALFTDGKFHSSPVQIRATTLAKLGALVERVAQLRIRREFDALNALIASDADVAALGRFLTTLDPKDIGNFKTPSLRNIALIGPYMHDGGVVTLSEAVDLELYSRSSQHYPLVLTEDERSDLLQFLAALSSRSL
jgi:cytochrome c peroxidase